MRSLRSKSGSVAPPPRPTKDAGPDNKAFFVVATTNSNIEKTSEKRNRPRSPSVVAGGAAGATSVAAKEGGSAATRYGPAPVVPGDDSEHRIVSTSQAPSPVLPTTSAPIAVGSPVTPRTSEFHRFAEHLIIGSPFSLMSPIVDGLAAASSASVPTSRDWGNYHSQLDSKSSSRGVGIGFDPAQTIQAMALAAEGFPLLLSSSGIGSDAGVSSRGDDAVQRQQSGEEGEEGEDLFFSIDPSSQRHLQSSTETLASRLTKRKWASSGPAAGGGNDFRISAPRLPMHAGIMDDHSDFLVDPASVGEALNNGTRGGAKSKRGAVSTGDAIKRARAENGAAVLTGPGMVGAGALGSPPALRLPATPGLSPPLGAGVVSSSGNGWKPVTCNCKKSKCLKLYCDCFRLLKLCEGCNCSQCANVSEFESLRQSAILSILERNPEAFKPHVTTEATLVPSLSRSGDVGAGPRPETTSFASPDGVNNDLVVAAPETSAPALAASSPAIIQCHSSGCHCKKSACLKKYCVCFQAKVPCQGRCRCQECKNTVTDGVFYDTTLVSSQGHVLMSPDGMTPLKSALVQPNAASRILGLSLFGSPVSVGSALPASADAVLFGATAAGGGGGSDTSPAARTSSASSSAPDSRSSLPSLSSGAGLLSPGTPSPSVSIAPGRLAATVSVDVLSSILAAKLSRSAAGGASAAAALMSPGGGGDAAAVRASSSSLSAVLSPVDIIRSELIRLQKEGLLLSPVETSV